MSNPKSSDHNITLSPNQLAVYLCPARFRIVVAGRRFGKTFLALAEMVHAATERPHQLIWYVGPNDRQSKRIVWDRLKSMTRSYWAKRPTETDLRIHFANGSTIVVNGAFHPDSLRGVGLDLLVLDEFASLKPEAWTEVFRPALSDRQGRALFIGTPKGRNHFYDRFEYAQNDPNWQTFQFSTADGGNVTPDELSSVARELDPDSYNQEFCAQFINANRHRVYYTFESADHIRPGSFEPSYPLVWTLDFNVNPMSMLLIQRAGETTQVIDEIILRDGNTEAACQAFIDRLQAICRQTPIHRRPIEIEIYGDASGHQKRTSATQTDWAIIRQFFTKWKGDFHAAIRATSSNPFVRDRINCVNRRFRNHAGDANLFIDPKCRELIKDLEQVTWQTDSIGMATSELDKSDPARTHTSDALGYYLVQAFPLKPFIGPQSSGRLL